MNYVLRYILIFLWLGVATFIGTLISIVRYGNRNINLWTARLYSIPAQWLSGIRVQVTGRENIPDSPCVVLANHQGNLDLILFGAVCPPATVIIGKKELLWIPFFGIFFKAAKNIMINRKDRAQSVNDLKRAVMLAKQEGLKIWIFPEGTRNRTGKGMLPFKKGAFYMAIQAGIPLVPVVSAPVSRLVDKVNKKFMGGPALIKVLPPVPTQGLQESDVEDLMQKVRSQMLEVFEAYERH